MLDNLMVGDCFDLDAVIITVTGVDVDRERVTFRETTFDAEWYEKSSVVRTYTLRNFTRRVDGMYRTTAEECHWLLNDARTEFGL